MCFEISVNIACFPRKEALHILLILTKALFIATLQFSIVLQPSPAGFSQYQTCIPRLSGGMGWMWMCSSFAISIVEGATGIILNTLLEVPSNLCFMFLSTSLFHLYPHKFGIPTRVCTTAVPPKRSSLHADRLTSIAASL